MNINSIYQNGFYLLLGTILGGLIIWFSTPETQPQPIQIHVVKDTVKVEKPKVAKLTLNEKNLKAEIAKHNIPHPEIVLAQAKLETGHFKSSVCKKHNNLFGLRKGNKYRHYDHWTESVVAYKKLISSRYNGGCYYAFLNRIGYAGDPKYTNRIKELV